MTGAQLEAPAVVFRVSLTLYLSCKAATQVHGTRTGLGCLEPQHDGGGEFVVSSATAGLLLFAQAEQEIREYSKLEGFAFLTSLLLLVSCF